MFSSFLSIVTFVTFCFGFYRYYTKREIPRKKLMNCCFEYCDLDTRRILKYFLNIDLNTGLVILNIDYLTFSMCEHSASILVWEQILMHHCVSIVCSVLTFLPGGLVHHCWREFLKYNLFFAFEYSFQNEKCNCLFSFTNLLSVFF